MLHIIIMENLELHDVQQNWMH